jgi:hypothetical protein
MAPMSRPIGAWTGFSASGDLTASATERLE